MSSQMPCQGTLVVQSRYRKIIQQGLNAGERLSDCHLNKQRLINSLGAEVNESAGCIEETLTASPYKISRIPPVSSIGPETHAKHLRCPYGIDISRVFSPSSSEHT